MLAQMMVGGEYAVTISSGMKLDDRRSPTGWGTGMLPIITSQVDARVGHECRQPGDQVFRASCPPPFGICLRRFKIVPYDFVQWLEHNMRGAIPIRRLQSVVDEPLGGERETFCADGRSRDVAAQPFEFVALVGGGDHAGMQREPSGPRGRALVITRTRKSLQGARFTPGMRAKCDAGHVLLRDEANQGPG